MFSLQSIARRHSPPTPRWLLHASFTVFCPDAPANENLHADATLRTAAEQQLTQAADSNFVSPASLDGHDRFDRCSQAHCWLKQPCVLACVHPCCLHMTNILYSLFTSPPSSKNSPTSKQSVLSVLPLVSPSRTPSQHATRCANRNSRPNGSNRRTMKQKTALSSSPCKRCHPTITRLATLLPR